MRNKPKVSTNNTLSHKEKEEKILFVLKRYPEGVFPKILASDAGINVNTTKSVLKRLVSKGKINKKDGIRGLYLLVENSRDSIFDWNLHNTHLACTIKNYSGERINKIFDFGTLTYKFEIGKESKQASMHIITKHPLNISSICACYSFFAQLIKEYTNFSPETTDVTVSSIEFNRDYLNLKLDGVNCITLDRLLDQFKLYQKKSGVRAEYKLKVPIPFEAIMSMLLNSLPLELTNDIHGTKQNQDEIIKSQRKIIDLLQKLLNK